MSRTAWKDFYRKPEVQELVEQGFATKDPSLEAGELEARARAKRKKFAKSFGLHARIADVSVTREGGVRLRVTFDEDIAFDPSDLKELEINGVPLTGAQLVEIRRTDDAAARVQAVISVNVPRSSVAALRALPMKVSATTKDDVKLEAFKLV